MELSPSILALSTGLLFVRLVFGLGLAAHGAQKALGWYGGPGIKGTGAWFESAGFRPGTAFAVMASWGEIMGGMLVALGFLGPVGPALTVLFMTVAMLVVHRGHGFFVETNGVERPLLYAAGAVAIACSGPGKFSLDYVLGLRRLWSPECVVIALAMGVVGALLALVMRRKPTA